jgi:hypothetical protein
MLIARSIIDWTTGDLLFAVPTGSVLGMSAPSPSSCARSPVVAFGRPLACVVILLTSVGCNDRYCRFNVTPDPRGCRIWGDRALANGSMVALDGVARCGEQFERCDGRFRCECAPDGEVMYMPVP